MEQKWMIYNINDRKYWASRFNGYAESRETAHHYPTKEALFIMSEYPWKITSTLVMLPVND